MLSILPFLLIIVVFWFFMIRPQMKRQREAQQMQAELTPGTKVMLTSGIFGAVGEVTDDHVVVEIADGVAIRVVRGAIGRVLPEDFGQPESETETGTAAEIESHELNEAADGVVVEPVKPEAND